jgi:hypothetical protein
MNICRRCKSEDVHLSRTRTKWESCRKEITGKRPFRCRQCGWRGWAVDLGSKFGEDDLEVAKRALAPDPPHVRSSAFADDERRAELSLDQLDASLDNQRK